ncbi:hypothetical protein ACVIHI_004856 [Bradyrhizobium sp. USDA 4524]
MIVCAPSRRPAGSRRQREIRHADETDIWIVRAGPCGVLHFAAARRSGRTRRAGAAAAAGVCAHRAGNQRPARRRRARHGDGIAREPARRRAVPDVQHLQGVGLGRGAAPGRPRRIQPRSARANRGQGYLGLRAGHQGARRIGHDSVRTLRGPPSRSATTPPPTCCCGRSAGPPALPASSAPSATMSAGSTAGRWS